MSEDVEWLSQRLAELAGRLSTLQAEFMRRVADPSENSAVIARLQGEIAALVDLQGQLMSRMIEAKSTPEPAGKRPKRALVIDVLHEVGAPLPVKSVAAAAYAFTGVWIPPHTVPALRRADRLAYDKAAKKGAAGDRAWITVGLDWHRLEPIPGILALSDWPGELRIISPHSARIATLKLILATTRRHEALRPKPGTPLAALHRRLAQGIADQGAKIDPDAYGTLREKVERELDELVPLDREAAADAMQKWIRAGPLIRIWGGFDEVPGNTASQRGLA